jgi:hypothetical protein
MTPGATAFTRTPREAYSIASERVTAASPPLVRATRRLVFFWLRGSGSVRP